MCICVTWKVGFHLQKGSPTIFLFKENKKAKNELPNYSRSIPLYAMFSLISTLSQYLNGTKDKGKNHRLPVLNGLDGDVVDVIYPVKRPTC